MSVLIPDETKGFENPLSKLYIEGPPSYEPSSVNATQSATRPDDTVILSLPLTLPLEAAPASQVRTYLRSYLYHNASSYDLEPGDAARIASAWRYGSGKELRSYDRAAWESLFGTEMGLVLFKHVEEKSTKDRRDEEHRYYRSDIRGMIISALVIAIMIIILTLVHFEDEDNTAGFRIFGGVFIIFPAVVWLITASIMLLMKVTYNRANAKKNGEYHRLSDGDEATELQRMETA